MYYTLHNIPFVVKSLYYTGGPTMLSEPMTLYKLMILYMLKQVKFPLTNSNISDFFVSKEYTTYFIVQQALSELFGIKLTECREYKQQLQI